MTGWADPTSDPLGDFRRYVRALQEDWMMHSPFAEPAPGFAPADPAPPRTPNLFTHAMLQEGTSPDGDDIWHVYVPGADTPPCGGEYHQPRRTPISQAIARAQGKPLCQAPGCFG